MPKRLTQSIKIDALYKPILRRFRSTFRKQFELNQNVKRFQHWSINDYIQNVTTFMSEFEDMPEVLLETEHVKKMLILLFPCIVKKFEYKHMNKSTTFKIFKENNFKLREKFFRDPLIKYLWSKVFISKHPEIIVNHLRRIRSQPENGELKYERLIKDLALNEANIKCSLLPE